MKQTSVEWLKTQIGNFPTVENLMTNIDKLLLEAIEKNKEEIIDSFLAGKRFSDGNSYAPNASTDIANKWFDDLHGAS